MMPTQKTKIFNDPVYGFITIPYKIVLDVIDHRYFQRLRRIKQLGLTHLVYPGALHTRFHHAIGCTHLMQQAVAALRSNGYEVTPEEEKGAVLAILLHDIGHGPFSHALEHSIVKGMHHEELSVVYMEALNKEFEGELDLAIQIFKNEYHKKFLYQLVSSQLDVDRLDYLKRDSFYTGVSEGVVSNERILKMLEIDQDELAIQQKGIYSIENFIVSRRLMYWQVYLHKTVLSAEHTLVKALKRAKELASNGVEVFCTPALRLFLYQDITKEHFYKRETLDAFANLDDTDILGAIKVWCAHEDQVLALLSTMIVNRQLLKVKIQEQPFTEAEIDVQRNKSALQLGISESDIAYFVFSDYIENNAYNPTSDSIKIKYKDGTIKDISAASDSLNIQALSKTVRKHFLCYPKG